MNNRKHGFLLSGSFALGMAGWTLAAPVTILSVDGTELRCGNGNKICPIPVFVAASAAATGGCVARVDIELVRVVGKNSKVLWRLYKDESAGADANIYDFDGYGIEWVDPDHPDDPVRNAAAKKNAANHFGANSPASKKEASWRSKNDTGSGRPKHSYRPTVVMNGGSTHCTATDPRIAND